MRPALHATISTGTRFSLQRILNEPAAAPHPGNYSSSNPLRSSCCRSFHNGLTCSRIPGNFHGPVACCSTIGCFNVVVQLKSVVLKRFAKDRPPEPLILNIPAVEGR